MLAVQVVAEACLSSGNPASAKQIPHLLYHDVFLSVHDTISQLILLFLAIVCVGKMGKRLESALPIGQLRLLFSHPLRVVTDHGGGTEAEPFVQAADGLDADNGFHRRVVACAGIGDNLDALDVGRLQFAQLAHVAHFLRVDVDLGLAFGHHFYLSALHANQRQFTDSVKRRAHIGQQRALHVHFHAAHGLLELRTQTLHRNSPSV